MANIILGFPNRIDSSTLSGGAWVESMPLTNLQQRLLSMVARSIDLNLSSTTFTIDCGQFRDIRVIAFVAHNFSMGGRVHLEFSNKADFSELIYDVWADAWPGVSDVPWILDELEWENDNFWSGAQPREDVEGLTPTCPVLLPSQISVRYIRVTIDDRSNPAGFVEVGRVFIGGSFLEPRINMSWGSTLGYEDATTVATSLSGAEFFDRREPVRVMRFSLGSLSQTEGMKALDLQRRAGISGEVFVIADPDDATYGSVRNFLGRLRQLSPLESLSLLSVDGLLSSTAFEIKEIR